MKMPSDELSIYEVESLHKSLLEAFEENKVEIDMQNVIKIDMSIIQLLIATQKSCINAKKLFELQNVSETVENILKNCACDFLLGNR